MVLFSAEARAILDKGDDAMNKSDYRHVAEQLKTLSRKEVDLMSTLFSTDTESLGRVTESRSAVSQF
jgi:hypothetical protein